MNPSDDWATAVRCSDILLRGNARSLPQNEPPLLMQQVARNLFLCGAAVEYYSNEMPVWVPKNVEEERLRPIDVLYGCYSPKFCSIEIFVRRIEQDASLYDSEPDELLQIVRLHEYAHAVIHLGIRIDDTQKRLRKMDLASARTAWSSFREERSAWFESFPNHLHEFLAQALTYAALSHGSAPWTPSKMLEVFDALEAKQPADYRLSKNVKESAIRADWSLILDVARENVSCEESIGLANGLAALICLPTKTQR